jgi:hypothetical protein
MYPFEHSPNWTYIVGCFACEDPNTISVELISHLSGTKGAFNASAIFVNSLIFRL